MRRLSRRKFFGLVGCAAAAAALPRHLVGELEPAVGVAGSAIDEVFGSVVNGAPSRVEFEYIATGVGGIILPSPSERYNDVVKLLDEYMERLAFGANYRLIGKNIGTYMGIERTAKP